MSFRYTIAAGLALVFADLNEARCISDSQDQVSFFDRVLAKSGGDANKLRQLPAKEKRRLILDTLVYDLDKFLAEIDYDIEDPDAILLNAERKDGHLTQQSLDQSEILRLKEELGDYKIREMRDELNRLRKRARNGISIRMSRARHGRPQVVVDINHRFRMPLDEAQIVFGFNGKNVHQAAFDRRSLGLYNKAVQGVYDLATCGVYDKKSGERSEVAVEHLCGVPAPEDDMDPSGVPTPEVDIEPPLVVKEPPLDGVPAPIDDYSRPFRRRA